MTPGCNICRYVAIPSTSDVNPPSDICPKCNLRVRHRAVSFFLDEYPEVKEILNKGRVLFCHMTPDERRWIFAKSENFLNFDIRPMKYLDLTMDIQDMHRIQTASIDAFVALHVLNHVADDARAIAEIARVLKPLHGILLLTVPIRHDTRTEGASDITQHYGDAALKEYGVGSYRHYGRADLLGQLEGRFSSQILDFSDNLVKSTESVVWCRRNGEPS